MCEYIIGVDYGIARWDVPSFTVIKKEEETIKVIDSGQLKNFDYSKYVASEHQVTGEKEDLELFKAQFLKK